MNYDFASKALSIAKVIESNILSALKSESDMKALFALASVAVIVLLPLTLINHANCITIGYGGSVTAMALTLITSYGVSSVSPADLLAYGAFIYGIRLASFLTWRQMSVPKMREQVSKMVHLTLPRLFELVAMLGFTYACMVCPVLFALRGVCDNDKMAWSGVIMAYTGLLLETIADQHKYWVKRQHKISYGDKIFVGPTTHTYAISRHPNFLGETMFWTGLWLGSIPYFGSNRVAWFFGTVGLISIVFIMVGSSQRMDKKQQEFYGGQQQFEDWKKRVKGSMFPRII